MGVVVPNGRQADPDAQAPAWVDVDPRAVVAQLTNQLAGMIQQLAMRDAYIEQLHQALAIATGQVPVPQEEPA